MPLEEGAIYHTPDGRRLRATSDPRRYHAERAWTLTPVDAAKESISTAPTRDRLSGLLFVEGGKLYRLVFEAAPLIRDTSWTVADLVKEVC